MILGGKCGDPAHGLWRAADNTILTPSGVVIATPGLPPTHIQEVPTWHWPPGDSFAVRVPDQPAVANTAEDDAAGRHWLNYGILSGIRHRLYGKELGWQDWLYVAPDKTVWLAHLVYTISTGQVWVSLRRWGDFRPGMASDVHTIATTHGAGMTADKYMIDDINSDGSQILVTVFSDPGYSDWTAQPGLHGVRWCKGGIKVTLSGNPPAATVSAEVMVMTGDHVGTRDPAGTTYGDYAGHWATVRIDGGIPVETYVGGTLSWTGEFNDNPPYDGPTGLGWSIDLRRFYLTYEHRIAWARDTMVGMAFDATGVALVVSLEIDRELTKNAVYNTAIADDVYVVSGGRDSSTISQVRLMHGAGESNIDAFGTEVWGGNGVTRVDSGAVVSGSGTYSADSACGGYEYSTTEEQSGPGGLLHPDGPQTGFNTGRVDPYYLIDIYAVRFGNGLYGLMQVEQTAAGFETVRYSAILSPTGTDATEVVTAAPASHFASRNPGTGVIARSATPICWV